MSTTAIPPVDMKMLEETRRHINRLIEEVGRLAEGELSPAEFYGELLKRVLAAMAAPAGAVWTRIGPGNLQLQFHINIREVGLDRSEESKQIHDELLRKALLNPQPIHLLPHSGTGPVSEGRVAPGNPTDYILLLVPILLNNEVQGFIEVWQGADRPMNAIPGFLQFMSTMADLAARFTRNQLMGQMAGQQQVWTQLEVFARQVHNSLKPVEVAYVVANEGRRLVDCDRVSVGIRVSKKVRVEAVSGCDVVERRSNLIVLMQKLLTAVLKWGERLVYTGTKDESLPAPVLHALDAYLAESNSKLLVVQPLKDEREKDSKKPPRSAMLMECFEPQAEPQQLVARLEVVGRHAAPALYNAVEYRRIPFRFLWLPLAKLQEGMGGRSRAIVAGVVVLLAGLTAAMILVPYPLKMDAKGQLLPITRRFVYAGEQGRVVQIAVRPKDSVAEDHNLLKLYNPQIAAKANSLNLMVNNLETLIREVETQSIKDPDDTEAKVKALDYRKELAVQRSELESLTRELLASANEPGNFYVRSPRFTAEENSRRERYRRAGQFPTGGPGLWTILSSDFREQLAGRQVDPSVPLIRIGDKESGFEIELKIPQRHLHQVMSAFARGNLEYLEVDLLIRTNPERTFRGLLYLDRLGAEATPERNEQDEAEPVVTAYVTIDDPRIPEDRRVPAELLVTGAEVLAKVRCGDAPLGYALFYGVWEFFCEKVLFSF